MISGGADFPFDALGSGNGSRTLIEACLATLHELLPEIKRLVVHGVGRKKVGPACTECFGVYLIDNDGAEHPFLHFEAASSATYAALRVAQVYRLGIAFGNFAEPRLCTDWPPSPLIS
ncbi:hypothetical protein [Trinickia fusca]|uniref:Uncharacterized protein n=1 Tax=Trinickia fusca TaxID=2419777 RepID=A0A494X6Y9_9BURK|nr:hypothetical protein [Trinickia fusca]RKP46052.1 hypothetical protein D7S89_18985 [Trinickia fusca]